MIQVRYFAVLRERMGRDGEQLETAQAATVAEVWGCVSGGAPLPANTLCAINLEYADPAAAVRDGDEVAFFPPVTGG